MPLFRARLTQARDIVRELGLRRSLRMAPGWLLAREFHVVATAIDVRVDVAVPPAARSAVLQEKDLIAFVRACRAMSVREVRRRWGEQQVCLVCWIGTEVASYRWDTAAATYLPYLGRRLRVAPGDVITLETRTLPGHRRTGAGSVLLKAKLDSVRGHGVRRLVGVVAAWNRPSLAWAAAVGWVQLGVVGYRRVGWRRRYFVEGALRLEGGDVVVLPDERLSAPPDPGTPGSR